jgi:hypothetical protein
MSSAALTTGTTVAFRVYYADNDLTVADPGNTQSSYVKIAISDGTYYPRGAVFYTTWMQSAAALRHDTGQQVPFLLQGLGLAATNVNIGRTNVGYETLGYLSAVGVGSGRLYMGSSQQGVMRYSAVLGTDTLVNNTSYVAGANAWMNTQHYLFHGQNGHGNFGYDSPKPTGDANIDYFLTWNEQT